MLTRSGPNRDREGAAVKCSGFLNRDREGAERLLTMEAS